ncbi:MAG: hypothetical protein J5911_00230 [Clostridia bacterium]|nr:hypothetical protein [Clostridia bacterium]
MGKNEELAFFIAKTDELIDSKYIIADIKIVGVLKAIAASDTLVAIFKNCLTGFDYQAATAKYLVKSKYLAEGKGEFVLPSSSRELLAFIFSVLVDIDAKRIDFSQFINKYFYEDGSCSAGYAAFINSMIKPFRNSVKMLMESVIEGKLQDPVEAFLEQEERQKAQEQAAAEEKRREKELSEKSYGESVKAMRDILLADKTKIHGSRLKEETKEEYILVIDMLANALDAGDKDGIRYAFIAYKFAVKSRPFTFFGRAKKVAKYLKEILNAL